MNNTTSSAKTRRVKKGGTIIRQGDSDTAAYIIASGTVEVLISGPEGETILATLGPSDIIGEQAALFGQTRSASVRAVTDCTLMIVDTDSLRRKFESAPASTKALLKILSARIARTNASVLQPGRRSDPAHEPPN